MRQILSICSWVWYRSLYDREMGSAVVAALPISVLLGAQFGRGEEANQALLSGGSRYEKT
jgi:hypothetical protein